MNLEKHNPVTSTFAPRKKRKDLRTLARFTERNATVERHLVLKEAINMRHSNVRRQGLILLIVLGMLTLFSLLAISYVVFSGQSRSANFSLARLDFHGMKEAEVIDEAMKQILRGTSDNISAVGPHSLLADMYGHSESSSTNLNNLLFKARGEGELFAGRFLRIPLSDQLFTPLRGGIDITSQMASEHDAFTGRVLSFLNGPLAGVSFRIVRSVAAMTGSNADLQHSLVIDLDEAGPQGAGITAATAPRLCFDVDGSITGSITGYQMWINARELNGLGYGIPHSFDGNNAALTGASGIELNLQPGLQPNSDMSGDPPLGQILGGQIGANNSRDLTRRGSAPSDSDEGHDAPDLNDFFLAHTRLPLTIPDPADASVNGLPGQDIIPSFHRAALVNYIINREDLSNTSSFTQDDFVRMLDDIQGACGRPLGISVVNMEGRVPYFSANPYFDGSNPGSAVSTPVLSIDLRGNWSNWGSGSGSNPSPRDRFLSWARMLTGGPWDVDNDGDGINDSVWVDIDLPLITSAEGKLLKMMAAYYIEDLDNRLDLNAVGNQVQSTGADFVSNTGANRNYTLQSTDLPQGFGLGPAETTLRHLFTSDTEWRKFLDARYGGDSTSFASGVVHLPGRGTTTAPFDDMRSQLNGGGQASNAPANSGTRGRRQNVRHDMLPGLPSAPRGDFAIGFDRMGNPLLLSGTNLLDQGTDDPYESRLISTSHQDQPFTIAEWERVYRHRDWDRSTYPRRLENFTPIVNRIGAVTPRSSHTRHVPLAAKSVQPQNDQNISPQISTFRELLDAIGKFRPTPVPVDPVAYAELFPLEFKRAQAMDLNRPFGNGIDDNDNGSIDEPSELLTGDLFNGNNLDLLSAGLQQAAYVVGTAVQRTNVSEFPVLSPLFPIPNNPENFGYRYGNLDPEYEQFVNQGLSNDTAARSVANQYHGQQSRQLMARHLYCLAMLLLPDDLAVANRPTPANATPTPRALTGLERAHTIAQWAVNVIDFRDADHVMTRFAYDPYPFVEKSGSYWVPNRDASNTPAGYVVWGMEQPELLLTETGATHDLRIKDTAEDASGKKIDSMSNPDSDYDQYRIPQGSLFLELMSPRTTAAPDYQYAPGTASSLYTTEGGTRRMLDLGKLTPSNGTTRFPVWRVAISEPHAYPETDTFTPTPNNIVNGYAKDGADDISRHDVSYQLAVDPTEARRNGLVYYRRQGTISSTIVAPKIDRLLWFVNPLNRADMDIATAAVGLPITNPALTDSQRRARVYFNESTTSPLLAGGQYLVVGPRETTYFGSKTAASTAHNNEPNDHRIEIDLNNWAELYINSGTPGGSLVPRPVTAGPTPSPLTRNIVSMLAVTTPPWNRMGPWAETTTRPYPWVGLNVSEPHPADTGYYTEPTHQLNSGNSAAAANGAPGFADLPFDAYYDYSSPGGAHPGSPFDNLDGTPIKEHYEEFHPAVPTEPAGVAAPGTQLDWCTAFLQRLADPERPFHSTFNPYITVDWMPIDLTVFSGEDKIYTDTAKDNEFEDAEYKFGFRSKNGSFDASSRGRTFLSYFTDVPVENPVSTGATPAYFPAELPVDNTSGSLSVALVPRATAAAANFTTLGYLNSPYELSSTPPPDFIGAPTQTPATLQWNNRDFASPYELMLVPLSSPGQLMQEFSAPITPGAIDAVDHYTDLEKLNAFSHLPNFFQEATPPPTTTPPTFLRHTYTLATLLELVSVPSQWSDADKIIPPASFDYTNGRQVALLGPIMPPYNRLSQMREPGRVNINTLEEVEVMRGLEWSYADTGQRNAPGVARAFQALKDSRDKSYITPFGSEQIPGVKRNTHLDGRYPTQFPGAFKSPLAAGRVTPTRIGGLLDKAAMESPANAGLLRKGLGTNKPLFTPRERLVQDGTNPQTEYLPISRLANLTTTRSNVFAVRITIGYFEFDPTADPITGIIPGIGPEYGWDNGQSRRHRGFYVIDRSIPVAFESGQDLNTANCVLLRRIVE